MSSDPTQAGQASVNPLDAAQIEQARRQVNQMAEEIAQLSEADMQPTQFYGEFLQRVYFAIHGFAAAIWVRTPQGNLQLQCQINLREVGLDRTPEARPLHDEMVRQAALQGKRGVIRPHFSHNFGTCQERWPGNPTINLIFRPPSFHKNKSLALSE